MFGKILNKNGVSIVAAVVTMLLLSILGLAVVALVINDQRSRVTQVHKDMSFYVWQAGTEYALREIDNGGTPEVAATAFGNGEFIVDVVPKVFVKEAYNAFGATPIEYTTSSTLNLDCFQIIADGVNISGTELRDLGIRKGDCGGGAVVTGMFVTTFPNEGDIEVQEVRFDGFPIYASGHAKSGEFIDMLNIYLNDGLTHALSPIVFDEAISGKQIVVGIVTDLGIIRTLANVGDVAMQYQIKNVLAADCFNIDTSSVTVGGFSNNQIQGITVQKGTCVDIAKIAAIEMNFYTNSSSKITGIYWEGVDIYTGPDVAAGEPAILNQSIIDTNIHGLSPISFDSSIDDKDFFMIMTFSDTSYITKTFKTPDVP